MTRISDTIDLKNNAMFDVLIMYGGNTKKSDEDYVILDKLLDRTRVTMNRVPQRGEGVNLFIENSPQEVELKLIEK